MENQIIISTVKEICRIKGITQEQLAEKSGLTQPQISRILSLKQDPLLSTFLRLCRAVDVNFCVEDIELKQPTEQ